MKRVVITGVGAITPVGNDAATMWENMKSGVCGIGIISKFDPETSKAKVAAEVKGFDPVQYIDKREVRKLDLFCQYALAAAAQATEDSGIIGKVDPQRLGVYVGSGVGGINTFYEQSVNLYTGKNVSPFFIPMMIGNIAAGNIAIKYNATGSCLPVVTACSTSTHALGEAFHAIKYGLADAIIAGGAEATITPLAVKGFTSCKALTLSEDPNRASIPFDKERSGFGNTCDAHHITAPDPEGKGAANCVRIALNEAGYQGTEQLYINAHGTSTKLNDAGETRAFKEVLGDRAYKAHISSTKSMTGHMLGATGAVEGIVAALALKDGIVPPTINYREPDPECDLDYTPNKAVKAELEMALSTTFGFGGHNACIVIRK